MSDPLDRLPDDALVVRGGHKSGAQILRRATLDREALGYYGISAFAGASAEMTLADIVQASSLPFEVVQTTTVGAIRRAGFQISRTGKWPHCTIDLGENPSESTADTLAGLFGDPVPNPAIGGR